MKTISLIGNLAVLLALPAVAGRQDLQSACADKVCVKEIRWDNWQQPRILGTLTNDSSTVLENLTLVFTLKHRDAITGSAMVFSPAPIPVGGKWSFAALVLQSGSFTNGVTVTALGTRPDGTKAPGSASLTFTPVWNPREVWEKRRWERQNRR